MGAKQKTKTKKQKQKTSHDLLKNDTRWPDLSIRRKLQQCTMLHKVVHKKFPLYLLNTLPHMSDENTRLERRYKFNVPPFKHAYYRDSVIPKSISEWNDLPNNIRTNSSIKGFKWSFKQEYFKLPAPLYNHGERLSQMSHTRIRVHFSNLNHHLYNYNLSATPNCEHCHIPETPTHYLLDCNKYFVPRIEMFDIIEEIMTSNGINIANTAISLQLLLHGKDTFPYLDNIKIFDSVHSFIRKTNRNP